MSSTRRSGRGRRRHPQAGKPLQRREGQVLHVHFPDGGARPLKLHLKAYKERMKDHFGSHHDGRHKLG